MNELFRLDGEVAVVTGGTGVLGGVMANALAAFGARVAVLGRSAERGRARTAEIAAAGGTAEFFAADCMSGDDLLAAKARIDQWAGQPAAILVNAAGGNRPDATIAPGDNFCDLPTESWREVLDLNLVGGVLLPSQIFGRAMVEQQRGSVINVASMAGRTPLSRVVAYSASKAAVINLTQWLAREWAESGVRVNAISPGFFPAEQNRALLFNDDGSYTERGSQIIGHTPMQRFGKPDELAGVTVWLASGAASSFVTGQNISVDGGFLSATI